MKIFEYIIALFFIAIVLSFSYAVVKTAQESIEIVEENKEKKERVLTLPEKCQSYYNDGTDKWKDCMGVGYVSAE